MSDPLRRFYKEVTVARESEAYAIHLDGRVLKTPGKMKLVVSQKHVAKLIAGEWSAQGEHIKPDTMPVTRLANVSVELTPGRRPELIKEARSYASTDLLCYRDEAGTALARHQAEQWDPVLAWASGRGMALIPTHSILAIQQDDSVLDKVAAYAGKLDDLHLTLYVHLIAVFGSAILGLAVMEKHLSGLRAFDLSRLDADWQIAHWGEDEEAKDARDRLAKEVKALCEIIGDRYG